MRCAARRRPRSAAHSVTAAAPMPLGRRLPRHVPTTVTAAYTHRAERPDGGLYPEDQPQRVDAWNDLLRTVAARRGPEVSVLDIGPLVCPGGKFTWRIDGMRVRSDGLHYTPAAVQRLIAPWLLPKLARI